MNTHDIIRFYGCTVILFLVSCADNSGTNIQNETFSISPISLGNMDYINDTEWVYAWPHDIMPLNIKGFEYISGPIDMSVPNQGKNARNWKMPLIFRSLAEGIEVDVLAAKQFRRTPMTSVGQEDWGEWASQRFAILDKTESKISYASADSIVFNEALDSYTYFLIMRDQNNLFRIKANGKDAQAVKKLVRSIGREIESWRINDL